MSSDEVFVTLLAGAIAALKWWGWCAPLLSRARLGDWSAADAFSWTAPLACHVLIFAVLRMLAADDVRSAPEYIAMYLALGSAWVGGLQGMTIWLGVGGRDDAIERSNLAAAIAASGALLGLTLCYAGGNIGNGPGWWVVVVSAALATTGWFVAWWIVEAATRVSELVTIERDAATGLRLGAFLLACGWILGRAVAGDWVSLDRTVADFGRMSWPVIALVVTEIFVGKTIGRSAGGSLASQLARGVVPAAAYVGGACYVVATRGSW